MFKPLDRLAKVSSNFQRSLLSLWQKNSEIDQESKLWQSIKDDYASTVVGGSIQFNHTLMNEVNFPILDSLNIEELSSGVTQSPRSRIIFLNRCKSGCTFQ